MVSGPELPPSVQEDLSRIRPELLLPFLAALFAAQETQVGLTRPDWAAIWAQQRFSDTPESLKQWLSFFWDSYLDDVRAGTAPPLLLESDLSPGSSGNARRSAPRDKSSRTAGAGSPEALSKAQRDNLGAVSSLAQASLRNASSKLLKVYKFIGLYHWRSNQIHGRPLDRNKTSDFMMERANVKKWAARYKDVRECWICGHCGATIVTRVADFSPLSEHLSTKHANIIA
ncbi:hypothetical protein OC835_004945 [Tilletia horrida]|uniref:Uncharacterized protein n=1 Tax=Tilletia horrida TaxID=155126 RepID=A0AAN6GJJ4_9BASI|nr:hypothetical protein OC835_004945 [Tilletia horrida]KAK0537472.1 hypothetical protein OC842_001618 [Tilletia horrida]